jgi:threonine dehydratase
MSSQKLKGENMSFVSWTQPSKYTSDLVDIFEDGTFPVTMENIFAAAKRIENHIVDTKCYHSKKLSALTNVNIFLKCEYKQSTGSFKERGAVNAILRLNSSKRKKGIIAASAGNHALALAFHGGRLGIPVTVVMPTMAPLTKKKMCAELGANVIIFGDSFDRATEYARNYGEENGMIYIHGFDDLNVIAGQGSIGLEILRDVPNVDAVIVPVGGGGMMAGISMAIKFEKPDVEMIGVEPIRFSSCADALNKGEPVEIDDRGPTIADGLAVKKVGKNCFPIIQKMVDRMIVIDEKWTALSVLRVMELEKIILEGAGAIALAPFLAGILPEYEGKNVVLLFCGGNIDMNVVGRVIDYGLVADGRLSRFTAVISDRPGGLAHLCKIIGDACASIKEVKHFRTFTSDITAFTETNVEVIVETRDINHLSELKDILKENKINYEFHSFNFVKI